MRYLLATATVLQAYLSLADDSGLGNYYAPGRAERMFEKRAGRDFGTFQVDCKNSESACNNACYYIRCQAKNNPNANVITYIGPNGNNGEDDCNRMESGCQFKNPSSGSVCTNFSFSQKFSNPTATGYQCDEWPPALAQQLTFEKKSDKNSLRCMPGGENGSLGSKLGNYVNAKGGPYPGRPAGVMSRDDFFRVDFTTNIGTADQTKVGYCLGGNQPKCDNDGAQFGMTSKPTSNGKISAHYDPNGTDNHYRLTNAGLDDLFQCGVSFDRDGDNAYKNIILTDWQNNDVQIARSCFIGTNGGSCTVKGLPNDLKITRTGTNPSKNLFEYATGQNSNPNYFTWDSETSGDGRGPWTDPENDPNRKPLRYCNVVGDGGNPETTTCWFPCYKHVDGKQGGKTPTTAYLLYLIFFIASGAGWIGWEGCKIGQTIVTVIREGLSLLGLVISV